MNHRRPNPGELTPDDLFRPEPGAAGDAAEATQFLPPMPAAPQPYPQQPGYQQPPQQQQFPPQQVPPQQVPPQAPQAQPQAYGQQPYPQQGYQQPYAGPGQTPYQQPADAYYDEEPPARRGPSTRAIAIGVVAVCAVLGIGMGLLMNGGGQATAGTTAGSSASAQATGSSAAGAPAGTDPQAQALWGLLQNAASSRSAVIAAVGDIGNCQNLDQAAQDLRQAAQQRRELINQLGQLQLDHLNQGSALAEALRAGWTSSAQADEHYAAWAEANRGSCAHKHHAKNNKEYQAGNAASGEASPAKAKAAQLWNAVAAANNLPKRSPSQL